MGYSLVVGTWFGSLGGREAGLLRAGSRSALADCECDISMGKKAGEVGS